jgi:bacterial/archaeal transporter family-2 protein
MKGNTIFTLLALITGALIPIQAATNATFSKSVGNPYVTALVVFLVGLIGVTAFLFISGTALPTLNQLKAAPFYGYLGGVIVAVYVIMITLLVGRIGVASAIGLIVTGQILCAVVIDQFGLFGVTVKHIDLTRLFGVILLVAGVYFTMKK